MILPLTHSERAALRLAALLCGAPDEVTLAHDAVMQAVQEILDTSDAPAMKLPELRLFTGE